MKKQPLSAPAPTSLLPLVIGIYQLLGGLVGLGLLIRMAPSLQNPATSTWAGLALAAVLFSYSIVCGFLLFRAKRQAFTLSLINQMFQVISFGISGFAYNYVSGLKLGIGVDFLESWVFKFRLSISSFQFSIGAGTGASFVSVNLLALVLIYLLERAREEEVPN